MKNIKHLLFTLLMSLLMITNVYAKDSVEIKSITLDTKSENTVVNSEPTFNGLEMNYDLTFKQVNDYAKYKIVIENNKDYKVTEDKSFSISEYVTYKYESVQTLKANETTTLYVIITYNKEVDSSLLVEGKYKETNKAVLQMTDENNIPVSNPKTGTSNILLLLSFVAILSVCIVVMINRQQKSFTLVILLALCLAPMITKAIEDLKLTINVNVEIQKIGNKYEVGYLLDSGKALYLETDSYVKTPYSECTVVYIGNTKYDYCDNVLVKDTTLYEAGTTANLKTLSLKFLYNGFEGCTLQEDDSYLCPNNIDIRTYEVSEWKYAISAEMDGYTYSTNDKEVMNFSDCVDDSWESEEKLLLLSPQTFTMPEHNVLFVKSVIK